MAVHLRKINEQDIAPLYDLWCSQSKDIPHQPRVRPDQFAEHLTTSRLYQNSAEFDPKAEIAVVALCNGKPVAFACGGQYVQEGHPMSAAGEAHIRLVLADPKYRAETRMVIGKVRDHLLRFNPTKLMAFDYSFTPVFFGNGCGFLPSQWGWLGHCLKQEGFEPDRMQYRMYRDMKGRGRRPKPVPLPGDWTCTISHPGYVLDNKYILCCHFEEKEELVGLCGSYYSGAFVRGSGHRYIATNWITVPDTLRGKGFGRIILRHTLTTAYEAGAKGAILSTDVDNFVALDLYRSEGYIPIDTVCDFIYRGPELNHDHA